MNVKRLILSYMMLISFIVVGYAQNSKLTYGYVEKTSTDQLTTHYAHIILEGNQIIMNRIVIYADSTAKEQGRQELKETYYLADDEINQLEEQLKKILINGKMPELDKIKKENILLSQNIEDKIDLNSKRNLVMVGGNIYYLEYEIKLGDERDKMSDKEVDKFMELENILDEISKPVQQIYYQKSRNYRRPF